jgi:pimeloyl-ACP methyl ester carboxylesterase
MQPSVIFLHGFLSGPDGMKARYFSDQLAAHGIVLRRPDLNEPDFEQMTITSMVNRVAAEVNACPPGPVTLMGSSLGGFTALHFLDRHRESTARRVERLVLFAPAFEFPARSLQRFEAESPGIMERWRIEGALPMFHYAHEREMPLGYGFAADARTYSGGLGVEVAIPVLILHGRHDESVDYHLSVRYAAGRGNVSLHLLESNHQMNDSLPLMWTILEQFLHL